MASETLRSCPFCGGEAEMLHAVGEWWAICKFCKATTEAHTDKGFAIAAWNARAERTCQFTIKDNMNESEGMGDVWIECSACHCVFDFYADEWLMKMSYCPNCGRRVIA